VDDALRLVIEINQWAHRGLEQAVADLTDDEINWRVTPAANDLNVIVRHLRIESEWHLHSLMHGEPMPLAKPSPVVQAGLDAVPLDFGRNLTALRECLARFMETLRRMTAQQLADRTLQAYGPHVMSNADVVSNSPHLLGYHQALHVRRMRVRFARFGTSTRRAGVRCHGSFRRTQPTRHRKLDVRKRAARAP
jgi:uncharacterized phage-associated protein